MKAYRYMEDNMNEPPTVKLFELDIIKITPCGFWVETDYDSKRKHFVNKNTHKKYAHLNKKDALISFVKRKESQKSSLSYKLNNVIFALNEGQKLLNTYKE